MFARCTDGPGNDIDYIVSIGTLEQGDPSVYEIKRHIFIQDTVDGGFADSLTHVDGVPIERWPLYPDKDGKQLPRFWHASPPAAANETSRSTRLHAYCKCGGVEFWLARPSARSAWAKEAFATGSFPTDQPLPPESETHWLRDGRTKFRAGVCPCDSCRLAANGNAFGSWAYVPTVDLSLDPDGRVPLPADLAWGTLAATRTSERASQHFCSRCGAIAFWNTDARPYLKDIGVGMFDAPEGARAESWLHWATGPMNHREDGLRRAEKLTLAIEQALAEYGEHRQKTAS